MKIDIKKENGILSVALEGRLDTVTAPELEGAIVANSDGVSSLTIDCSDLAYVSSAGLRVLLSAHKKMKGKMKLVNVCEVVMEVLEMTGFADIWEIV